MALAVVPALLLLICAVGMRQGRRLALKIAIAVQLGVVALSFAYLVLFASIPHFPGRGRTVVMGSAVFHILTLALVPLILAVLLFLFRGNFVVGSRRRSAGKWHGWLAVRGSSWRVATPGLARLGRYGARRRHPRPHCGTRPAVSSLAHTHGLRSSVRGT
ncbi:hypothetical protein AHiyo8_56670 [Arthrobacter sp. Hiyo8]|nr:hypothetical protein AHiyo8_56670 [Arthrobacter sp. Hiyo8]